MTYFCEKENHVESKSLSSFEVVVVSEYDESRTVNYSGHSSEHDVSRTARGSGQSSADAAVYPNVGNDPEEEQEGEENPTDEDERNDEQEKNKGS